MSAEIDIGIASSCQLKLKCTKFELTEFAEQSCSFLHIGSSNYYNQMVFFRDWIGKLQTSACSIIDSLNVVSSGGDRFWSDISWLSGIVTRVFYKVPPANTLVDWSPMNPKRRVIVFHNNFHQISEALSYFLRAHYNQFQQIELHNLKILIPDLGNLVGEYARYTDFPETTDELDLGWAGFRSVEFALEQLVLSQSHKLSNLVLCVDELQTLDQVDKMCKKLFRFVALGAGLSPRELKSVYKFWVCDDIIDDWERFYQLYDEYAANFKYLIFDMQTKQFYWHL